MSLVAEQAKFLLDVCTLIQWCTAQGWTVTGGELLRPVEMQEIYVKSGRSKTMHSKHIKKLAIDLNFFKNNEYICTVEDLSTIGHKWEELDNKNRWGGNFDKDWSTKDNFKDAPHFERSI